MRCIPMPGTYVGKKKEHIIFEFSDMENNFGITQQNSITSNLALQTTI
jgi:hypothetical protein